MVARLLRRVPAGAIYAVATAGASGLNFASLALWTRILSPYEFGRYSVILASVLLVNAAAFEWLRMSSARLLVSKDHPDDVNRTLADGMAALYLGLGAVTLLAAGVLAARAAAQPTDAAVLLLGGGCILLEALVSLINTLSRFRARPWQFFGGVLARAALSIIVGYVLAARMGLGLYGVLGGAVAAQAVTIAGVFLLDPLWRSLRPLRARWPQIAPFWKFGAPLIVSAFLTYALNVADRFLLQHAVGSGGVGIYAAASEMVQKTLVFVMMTLNLSAFPALVRTYEMKGAEQAHRYLERNFVMQLALGLPACIGFAVLAPELSALLLGKAFAGGAAQLLPWIAVAAMFRAFTSFHLGMALQVAHRTALMPVAAGISLVVLALTALPLIGHFGLVGMAYATVISQGAGWLSMYVTARKVFPIYMVNKDAGRVILASALMAAVLLAVPRPALHLAAIPMSALGGAAYGLALLALGFGPARAMAGRALKIAKRRG